MRLPRLFSRQRRGLLLRLLVNGLLQSLAAVAIAGMSTHLFDSYVDAAASVSLSDVIPSATLVLALSAAIALLRRRERIDAELMGQSYAKSVRKRLFKRIINSQQRKSATSRHGLVLMRFVGDLNAIRQWISLGLARLCVAGVSVTVVLMALGWLHWRFMALVAAVLLLAAAGMWWQGVRLELAIKEARRRQAYLAANMTEKVSHPAVVQLFGGFRHEQRYLQRQNARLIDAAANRAAGTGSLRAIVEIASGAVFAGALLLAVHAVQSGTASPGVFIGVLAILGFLNPPMRDLCRSHEYWLAYRIAQDKLTRLAAGMHPLGVSRTLADRDIARGDVEFDHVTVQDSLRGVSARAAAGQRIAVVGMNGSGKSTLLALAARLLDADGGRVLLDGRPIETIPLHRLRASIAYAGADVPLIRGSIAKNIRYGAPGVSSQHLAQVIRQCRIDRLLEQLPEGLETRVAERGVNLSQGQRAQISLARALIRRPKILLLDEADAHLDSATIDTFDEVVQTFQGTVLMISHRHGAIAKADRIWHLQHGQLVAEGDAQALLSSPGPTRKMLGDDLRLVG